MSPFLVVLIVLGAAVGFVAFWSGVVALIGLMGWRPLAACYAADAWPEAGEGVRLSGQSGQVGLSSYSGVLNAVLTEGGLYLRPMALFAVNHPPLFIPWVEMGAAEQGFFGGVRLQLDGGALTLYGRLGRMVGEAAAAMHGGMAEGAAEEGVGEERTERRAGQRVR